MRLPRTSIAWLALAAALLRTDSAPAVIKLDTPFTQLYDTFKPVLLGTISSVDPATRVVNIRLGEPLKGPSPGPRIRLLIVSPAELAQQVATGQPVLLFVGRGTDLLSAVHLADTWLMARPVPGTNMLAWRAEQTDKPWKQSFPGRTPALVRLATELNKGNRPILDRWERKPFAGGVRVRAKLDVQKPAWLLPADINGDQKPDLVVGTAAGTRLFLATAASYEDATDRWAAWGTAGAYHAAADVNGDGKTDLLLDDTLWINDGAKFAAKVRLELPDKTGALAAALADATGDKRPDAVLLTAGGRLRVYENPGSLDQPWPLRTDKILWKDGRGAEPAVAVFGDWGDDGKLHLAVVSEAGIVRYPLDGAGGGPADLDRLTGTDLRKNAKYRDGLKNVRSAALHMDGDGRLDLYALCDSGGLLLINRGFGAFLLDDDAAKPLQSPDSREIPFRQAPSALWAAADLHGHGCDDLLVLTADGTLYEVDNGK